MLVKITPIKSYTKYKNQFYPFQLASAPSLAYLLKLDPQRLFLTRYSGMRQADKKPLLLNKKEDNIMKIFFLK